MIADDLSRIAMSSSLSDASARAVDYARAQGHIEVSLEHMLLALCEDPDAALVLASSNVDVARLVTDVSAYLGRIDDRALAESAADPVVSADLRRIFEAAAAAARGGRRREINGAIVLAAIVGDGKSAAAHILRAQGLTFDGAIRALQRPAAAKPHNADDILANARERVQSRSVPGLGSRRGEAPSAPAAEPAPPPPASYEPPAPAEEEFSPSPARPDVAFDEPAATPEEESNSPSTPAYAPEPQPEFEPAPEAERRQEPEGSYARSKPSSAPFPPPIPVPEVPASWVPPPPPPAPASNAPPPMSRMPPPPPPMPAAPVVRPGPPPLAPWPEMDNSPGPQRGRAGGPPPASYDSAARRAPADRSPPHPMAQPARSAAARPGQAMRAEIGQLVENIPRTMRVAVPALVEVRIARADVKALAEGLQGGGAAYRHEVTVTKAMSVRLRAPDGEFFIETASPETQWIEKTLLLSSDDFASWRWNVTPRGRGRKRLQLIISARTVSADGLAAETALPDQVVTVRVRINYGRAVSRWFGWAVAAVIGGVLARFADVAYDTGVQVVAKLMSG